MSRNTDPAAGTGGDPLLRATGLRKHFPVDEGFFSQMFGEPARLKAVDGVDLSVRPRETVGLVGESGCGKSTLGRLLARLYEPTEGTVEFDGEDVTAFTGDQRRRLRRNVQYVFQDPLSSLNPRKTVGEIVRKPLEVHGAPNGTTPDERVRELFEEVGLGTSYRTRYPHELSGGQQQRVGIARALAVEPRLIVADEPVSALDVSVQSQIINLMKRVQQEYDLSYVFIAHDLSVVNHISDRIAVMYLGEVVEEAPTAELFGSPQHPYTRALLASVPRIDSPHDGTRSPLEGSPPSPIDPPSGCSFRTRCPEYIGEACDVHEPSLRDVTSATEPTDWTANSEADASLDTHRVACHWLDRPDENRPTETPLRGSRTDKNE